MDIMKRVIFMLLFVLGAVACGSQSKSSVVRVASNEPTQYSYKIKNTYPHLRDSYTQGLQFVDGVMWEGTGEYGSSRIVRYTLGDETPQEWATLPGSEFGEGITLLGDKLYQLTWESNVCHLYDLKTGKHLRDFRYLGEGWGLTSDGESLYMSNGTSKITKLNPETFRREGAITVTLRGEPVMYVNELEWIDGKIWANVYTTDRVLIINPDTGVVEGMIDFTGLLKKEDIASDTDVFNGIAYDKATGRIFVTGKRWNKLFEVEIVKL
jgi:glutamine cyclotransferase